MGLKMDDQLRARIRKEIRIDNAPFLGSGARSALVRLGIEVVGEDNNSFLISLGGLIVDDYPLTPWVSLKRNSRDRELVRVRQT